MKRLLCVLTIFILCVSGFAADYDAAVITAKNNIRGAKLVSHIDFLASKYCRGRETDQPGMDVAMKYITSVLKGAELAPAGDYGSYYQDVPLKTVTLAPDNVLTITSIKSGVPTTMSAKMEWDFLPIILSAEQSVTAPVVFAGYGITAAEHKYDDYRKVDAKGKIVLVLRHEPGERDPNSPFDGRRMSNYGTLLNKILNAQEHGAVGILFVTDPLNHKELTADATSGTSWPSLRKQRYEDDEDLQYMRFSPRLRIVGDNFGVRIPAMSIDHKLAEYLLGDGLSLLDLQTRIDNTNAPQSKQLRTSVTMQVAFQNKAIDASNIVAKVEGSDPELKSEFILVGAHYDHVGKDNRGRVYGGADDNASGTAGVIELARAFEQMSPKPRRSLLFVLFTAEEKGLLGSRYYVDDPVVPLDKTLAMINLDMIGRNAVDQISLIGRYQYPKLYDFIDRANQASVNMEINFSVEEFVRQSDHFPFMKKKVPSVFFNSGMHDQLHRPEDTSNRIIADKIEKVTQMVFLSLWDLANAPAGTVLK